MIRKSLIGFLAVIFAVSFMTSCATIDKNAIAMVKNAAVVSVYCDKRLDMSDFSGMASAIAALAQNEQFDLSAITTKLKDSLFNDYAKALPFKIMDEQTVIGAANYAEKAKSTGVFQMSEAVVNLPQGYKAISILDKKTILAMFEAVPGADAGIIMSVSFKLRKVFEIAGFGTAKVESVVTLMIKDKNYKTVLYRTEVASSSDQIKFALGGVFDASQIRPLCEQSSYLAMNQTRVWIYKEMQKK
jgi:hypothetical protein